ncbi:MAG: hypothetical protein JSV17_12650 [Candidatus Aminicenantes bacterium]|nr:MAG: hypothetical protein JSV17_12650 [Candidatus Aminicenantes bacterium]
MLRNPYPLIINFLVLVFFLLAFLSAELKGKMTLLGIAILLFGLPAIVSFGNVAWIVYAARIIFGLVCYLFIRKQGLL